MAGNIRELQNMIERGVILAPSGTRIEVHHIFSACEEREADEFGLDVHGAINARSVQTGQALCEAVCSGEMTLEQVETMLLESAVDKARGNLSSAARMLGVTRPQLAYRLRRLQEDSAGHEEVGFAPPLAPAGKV